ncbi:hypothetical protein [Kangiella sp. M94]
MKNDNQLFYLRQFVHLLAKGEEPRTAFNILVNEVPKSQLESWQQAHTIYEATQSLERAFEKLNIKSASSITEQLRRGKELGLPEVEVLQNYVNANNSELQIAQIIKSRLLRILSYCALLSVIALIVLTTFNLYLLPVYSSVLLDGQLHSSDFVGRMDILRMKSWWSLLLYLPPVIIIGLFALASFKSAESFTQGKFLTRLPIMKGIMFQLSRIHFVHNLKAFHQGLPQNKAERLSALNSPFFSNSERFTFDKLFNQQEREQLLALFSLQTFEQESPNLLSSVETQAVESVHQKTGVIATLLHLFLIFIVFQIVISIYLPIFQLGTGF